MQNILFRTDSSSTIGTGHIMRDLVLAEQFKDTNIIFATQGLPGNINHKIKEKGYALESLDSNNIEELFDVIKKYSIDMIVVDHYGIDYDVEKTLKEVMGVIVFVLDDTYEKHHCDILLNHNISADSTRYIGLVPVSCEIRCGIKYTLLRDEFKIIKKNKRDISGKNTLTVFIAMGGVDHSNKNIEILKVLDGFANIKVHVVTTEANSYLKELKSHANNHANVLIHINTNRIASIMNESDFAIVTPSVTVNEVLYMGIPFIAIQTTDNQNEIAQYLEDKNFQVLRSYDTVDLLCAIKTVTDIKYYGDTLINIDTVLEGN